MNVTKQQYQSFVTSLPLAIEDRLESPHEEMLSPRGITPDDYFPSGHNEEPTKSIPIHGSLQRTRSELQLYEDEMVADYRDYCMYMRIVSGMSQNSSRRLDVSSSILNDSWRSDTDESIANIIRTRHEPVHESSFYQEETKTLGLTSRFQHIRDPSFAEHMHPPSHISITKTVSPRSFLPAPLEGGYLAAHYNGHDPTEDVDEIFDLDL